MVFDRLKAEDEVAIAEGAVGIGGVRSVRGGKALLYIENFGEIDITPDQVKSVHDGKVILDLDALPEDVREGIAHAHDLETR